MLFNNLWSYFTAKTKDINTQERTKDPKAKAKVPCCSEAPEAGTKDILSWE